MHNRTKVGVGSIRRRAAWIAAAVALVASGLLFVSMPRVRALAQANGGARKATATLRFDGVAPEIGGVRLEDFESFQNTAIAVLRSRPILQQAISGRPELLKSAILVDRPDPVDWLATKLEIQVIPKTRLVEISLDSPVWQESAAIVDAVIAAYLAASTDARNQSLEHRIRGLRDMQAEARRMVEMRRRELREAEDSASDDAIIEVRRGLEIQDLREIRQAIRKILIEKAAVEALLALKKSDREAGSHIKKPLEDQIAVLSAQVAMLSRDEDKGLAVLRKLEPSRVDFQRLKKEVERAEVRATEIETELDRISRESRSAPAHATVLSPAR
jgi:hypothetical protein